MLCLEDAKKLLFISFQNPDLVTPCPQGLLLPPKWHFYFKNTELMSTCPKGVPAAAGGGPPVAPAGQIQKTPGAMNQNCQNPCSSGCLGEKRTWNVALSAKILAISPSQGHPAPIFNQVWRQHRYF